MLDLTNPKINNWLEDKDEMSCIASSTAKHGGARYRGQLELPHARENERSPGLRCSNTASPLVEYAEPRWYAAYICANHEKPVAAELKARAVEHFLPLYSAVRRWKDRRVRLDLPLFPGYVFVHLALRERLRVLQIPSVVRLVGFGGHPVALPEDQMETLRSGLIEQLRAEPCPFLNVGRRVRIKCGPLTGIEGVLLRRKGRHRVAVSIEMIQRSMSVDVDVTDLEPIRR